MKHSHALPLLGSVVGVLGQVAEPHLFGLWGAETNNELVTTNRTVQLQHTPNIRQREPQHMACGAGQAHTAILS